MVDIVSYIKDDGGTLKLVTRSAKGAVKYYTYYGVSPPIKKKVQNLLKHGRINEAFQKLKSFARKDLHPEEAS